MEKNLKLGILLFIMIALISLFYTILAQYILFFSVNFWIQTSLIISVIPAIFGYFYRKRFWESMKISAIAVFVSVIVSYLSGTFFYSLHIYSYFVEGIRNSSPVMSFFLAVCRPYLLAEQAAILNEGNIAVGACPLSAFDKTFLIIAFILISMSLIAGFMGLGKFIYNREFFKLKKK